MSGRLILASRSPQRVRLLADAGYVFEAVPADIDEQVFDRSLSADQIAVFLARSKADAVADRYPNDWVLGADTIVVCDGELLGKPKDAEHAARMIRKLGGSRHTVVTGICLYSSVESDRRTAAITSTVQMKSLDEESICRYVASGDWAGKAGGYGIQLADRFPTLSRDDPFVRRTSGSESNIIGLPMEAVTAMLATVEIYPAGAR